VGTVSFDVYSNTNYRVEITPPNGYSPVSSAPYHRVQQEIEGRAIDGGICRQYYGASNNVYNFSHLQYGKTTTYVDN
jgi:hypothetical protein